MSILTRFAPSPTGYLHLGHALAAREAFGFGPCLLRIEDIDHTRCKAEYTRAIYEDLDWLGFDWPVPVRVQSQHMSDYHAVTENLHEKGLIYRCFKTRKEIFDAIAKRGTGDLVYRGPSKPLNETEEAGLLAKNTPFAWRLSINKAQDYLGDRFAKLTYEETGYDGPTAPGTRKATAERYGDEVIARKDIGTSYHIAVTHDDALQNITHVVRGVDLADSTGFHVLLQALMEWPTPVYHHHRLLLRQDGEKLSKRDHDTTIRSFREDGYRPDTLWERLA